MIYFEVLVNSAYFEQIFDQTSKNIQEQYGNMCCNSLIAWSFFGHFLDLAMAIATTITYWGDDWANGGNHVAGYNIYVISIIMIVVHILEILIQCCVKDTYQVNPFYDNPKSFYTGFIFTILYLLRFGVLIGTSFPNIYMDAPEDEQAPTIFSILLTLTGIMVIVGRSHLSWKYQNENN